MASEVLIRHFDEAIVKMTGATVITAQNNGRTESLYAFDLPKVEGPEIYGKKIPVFFAGGDQNYVSAHYPCVVIKRTSLEVDDSRKQGWSIESSEPAPYAEEITVTDRYGRTHVGYNKKRLKAAAIPYKITYELELTARGGKARSQAQLMFEKLSRIFTPDGIEFLLIDSIGDERGYNGTVELDNEEYNFLDLSAREHKRLIRVVIDGEIDFYEPFDTQTVSEAPTPVLDRMDS